jgi:hypothetical protein
MRKSKDRNLISIPIPGDLTDQLIAKIEGLSPSIKTDYLKANYLSKFVGPLTDSPLLRRTRAIEKWLETERQNEETNERLIITDGEYNILPRVMLSRFVDFCTDLVIRIIGEVPPEESLIGSFSGGASTSRPRTVSHPATKYVGKSHVTSRALDVFNDTLSMMPLWQQSQESQEKDQLLEIEVVPGNVLFTVPKKSDIDRVACKEPDLNMFIQKGIGRYFRKALYKHGINLNDQSINRSLAWKGSVSDELSTLDLSSASDSVTRELVFMMLPPFWFTLLDSTRSPVTNIDGEEHRNEMFSSMGNGFTFELESLLFYVLARATAYFRGVSGVISVYGDDIICPKGMSHDLVSVLKFFGFTVNSEKSSFEGPFRESCGGHYYNGLDITPFFIRKPIDTIVDLIHTANSLRQWSSCILPSFSEDRRPLVGVLDPEVEPIWLWLKGFIPSDLWGGVDTSFKYQLVSNDKPRMRISEETRRKGTGYGGYLHWHNATWDRDFSSDGVSTSRLTSGTSRFRLKKARISTVDRLLSFFLHEL